jgi:glycosyltransferase involved in cell wall biosynthesis
MMRKNIRPRHKPSGLLQTTRTNPDIGKFRGARIGSLAELFHKQKITALLINGWVPQAYWQAAFQAYRAGIPVLLRGETNDLRKIPRLKELAKRLLLKLLFDRISVFLTVGVANRRFYLKYGVPEYKMAAAPYCVENERFFQASTVFRKHRDELREAWKISKDSVCFLFSGKLIHKKHVLDLIDAFGKIVDKSKQSQPTKLPHLLIVGDGALKPAIQEKAERLRIAVGRPLISVTGFLNQTEMPKAYAIADCLVLPSDAGETWGLVVNEAMACGLPAIVSDQVGCGPDLIDAGATGEIFQMGNVEALARVMMEWSDPARCAAARMAVEEKIAGYSIDKAVGGIWEGYQRVAQDFVSSVRVTEALVSE